MLTDPTRAYGSMGNYLFNTDVLLKALREANDANGEHDFGHHILPRLIKTHQVLAYNFADNHVPGVADYEEQSYWRDVGDIDAYYEAHYDVLSAKPRFNLFNPRGSSTRVPTRDHRH
jgi:glucose-1-phosphate adenylyltransferase